MTSIVLKKFENNSPGSLGLFWFWLFMFVVAIDQLTKYFAFRSSEFLLFSRLGVRSFKNINFVFSLPLPVWLMYMVYAVVLLVITRYIYYHWHSFTNSIRAGWILIIAGALSNILERLVLGYVRDFFMINTGFLNLADIAILLGIVFLIIPERKVKSQ